MKTVSAFVLVITGLAFGCSSRGSDPHAALVVPDGFRGGIFLIQDKKSSVVWSGAPLDLPASGVLRIADLTLLGAIRPDAFEARYKSGQRVENRNRGGDYSEVGLWPVTVIGDQSETIAIYFVIGSFHEKTEFENQRMRMRGWTEFLRELKSEQGPNQPVEPTAASGRGSP